MKKILITPRVTGELRDGSPQPIELSWFMDTIVLGVPRWVEQGPESRPDATGGSMDGADELLFDRTTRELIGGTLWHPPVNRDWSDAARIAEVPAASGVLCLARDAAFSIPGAMEIAFEPGGRMLVGLAEDVSASDVTERVQVHEGFSLLVVDEQMQGWALNEPVKYLRARRQRSFPAAQAPAGANASLVAALSRVLPYEASEGSPVEVGARYEELLGRVYRDAGAARSGPILDWVEKVLVGSLSSRGAPNPVEDFKVASARHRKTGKTYEIAGMDQGDPRHEWMDPMLRERLDVQERMLLLIRDLCWDKFAGVRWSARLARDALHRDGLAKDLLEHWQVPQVVTGLESRAHLLRLADWVMSTEEARGGRLSLLDWVKILSANGSHAEVKAVNQALRGSAPTVGKDSGWLADIELDVDTQSRRKKRPKPVGRCPLCQYVTHGVLVGKDMAALETTDVPL